MNLQAMTIWLPAMLASTVRVGGIFLVAPVFSSSAVPARLRVYMSLVIGLAVASRLTAPLEVASAGQFALALASELLVGCVAGFAASLVLVGLELGAWHIGQQMGIGIVELFSPMEEIAGESVRRLYYLLGVVIFLAIGGHRMLIGSLLDTFKAVPPASFLPTDATLNMLVGLLASSFTLAIKTALPAVAALLLATAAVGMLQRTVPQLNILSVGLPLNVMIGMLAVGAGLAALPWLFESSWTATLDRIGEFLGGTS